MRPASRIALRGFKLFQSTHRVSDATRAASAGFNPAEFQSTHRVSDATLALVCPVIANVISIHAPRERCDFLTSVSSVKKLRFQSTHRVSDATLNSIPVVYLNGISIHAPRERCDS